jgi:hypothetical protein
VPELPAGYTTPLPTDRPVGLRRRTLAAGREWWRIDASPVGSWSWEGFAEPRHRFDPASGAFRVRYASRSPVGAARERYRASGLLIPADHASHHLVRLVVHRPLRVFDVRAEANLDVLGLDDQASTGQHPAVWETCHQLADRVRQWWDELDGIVYRSRTTPTTSANLAFFDNDGFDVDSWPLAGRSDVLVDLVLRHGFTVDWDLRQ